MMDVKLVDINKVSTIEHYVINLSMLCSSVATIYRLQQVALKQGILTQDEMEACRTIAYASHRLLISMDDQIKLVKQRSGKDLDKTLKNMIAQVKKTKPKAKK